MSWLEVHYRNDRHRISVAQFVDLIICCAMQKKKYQKNELQVSKNSAHNKIQIAETMDYNSSGLEV